MSRFIASRAARFLAALGCVLASAALAQDPNSQDLINALKAKSTRGTAQKSLASEPSLTAEEKALIQSLKLKTSRGLSVSENERTRLAQTFDKRPAVDLEINFDFNSSGISARTRPVLMSLGKALKHPDLLGSTFVVAGHTDRKGSAATNQRLSEQRANTVREFLITNFNIPGDQLIAVGYGFEKLKFPERPNAEENRRVQVLNMLPDVASAE
jgi:outer membrane protein OmpA-like peptidoglycan-associated protein